MNINLFNTLTKKKEKLIPINSSAVKMYACGPTLYSNPHIGNFRPIIVFDILFRVLRLIFGEDSVRYVRNITDIDDKIIDKANELKISTDELVNSTQKIYQQNLSSLSILSPTSSMLKLNRSRPVSCSPKILVPAAASSRRILSSVLCDLRKGFAL